VDGNFVDLDDRTKSGWRDNVVAIDVKAGDPNAAQLNVYKGGINLYSFADGQMTQGFVVFHIDHDYKSGTALYPHVHWSPSTATLGTVRWGFEWIYAKGHQQMAFGDPVTVYTEQVSLGIPYMHYISETSDANAIPGTGIETDGLVLLRIFRDSAHANDTFAGDVFGLCVDLHYQVDHYATVNKSPPFF
jgi:hypothetical protein